MASKDDAAVRVTAAVKTETAAAPLVGAPAVYLNDGPREVKIILAQPFKLGDTEYRDVTVKRLTGKQLFAINKAVRAGADPESSMFSAMLGIPVAAVEALDSADIQAISKASANFTPQSADMADEPTGENGTST